MWHLAELPFELPTATVPDFIDTRLLGEYFRQGFENLQPENFSPKAVWRDLFALTGSLRTFYTAKSISAAWHATTEFKNPSNLVIDGEPHIIRQGASSWVELAFTFETSGTPGTNCYGYISAVPDASGKWKIWIIRTILEGLKAQPSVDVLEPTNMVSFENSSMEQQAHMNNIDVVEAPNGERTINGIHQPSSEKAVNGASNISQPNGVTSSNHKNTPYFNCVIIGGGQAGLSVGGRLKSLGVSYVILEKHAEVGDNWKTRYDSTKLHTVREFGHLPFDRTFPSSYPEWLTKDDLASGYKRWAQKYDINIWLSTTHTGGTWNAEDNTWSLNIIRNGQASVIRSSFVVLAVGGNSQFPLMPKYENKEAFQGIVLHSAEYKNALTWKGKHGVVIGTANTAHDVADDMLEAGMASVTMVQRNKTYVVPREHYRETHDRVFNKLIPTTVADRMFFSPPAVLGRVMGSRNLHAKASQDPERFDGLEKAGFLLDREGDLTYYLFERFGGHYMDVGTSAKIVQGLIKMKSDSLPIRFTNDGLECINGDQIRADVVVFCTGFLGNLRVVVQDLYGTDVASQINDYWGLDEEGELKGAFKHSGHPGLFYHGGAVGQARYMSRFIALQIKAKLLGTPLPLYTATPPRNTFDEAHL